MRSRLKPARFAVVLAAVSFAGAIMFATPASALDLEPFIQFLDRGAQAADVVTETAAEAPALSHEFGSAEEVMAKNRRLLGFVPEEAAPTPEEVRNGTDWCYWFGLARSAYQINNGNTTSSDGTPEAPTQILFDNLTSCLDTHIAGVSTSDIRSLADALIFRNNVSLVQSQSRWTLSPMQASQWLQQYGLRFASASWAAWYAYSARTVPPSN